MRRASTLRERAWRLRLLQDLKGLSRDVRTRFNHQALVPGLPITKLIPRWPEISARPVNLLDAADNSGAATCDPGRRVFATNHAYRRLGHTEGSGQRFGWLGACRPDSVARRAASF